MNNLEFNLINDDFDLLKNLNGGGNVEENEYIKNYDSPEFQRYLLLIEEYFLEMKQDKYTSEYNYYVNEEGNFVKEANEKGDSKENMIIEKPVYVNCYKRRNQIQKSIDSLENKLRILRTTLLDGNKDNSENFDNTKTELMNKINEKKIIQEIINFNENKSNTDETLFNELHEAQIKQNDYYFSIVNLNKNTNSEEYLSMVKEYVQNNERIKELQTKIREKNDSTIMDYYIEKISTNKKPTGKKLKKKVKVKKIKNLKKKKHKHKILKIYHFIKKMMKIKK